MGWFMLLVPGSVESNMTAGILKIHLAYHFDSIFLHFSNNSKNTIFVLTFFYKWAYIGKFIAWCLRKWQVVLQMFLTTNHVRFLGVI